MPTFDCSAILFDLDGVLVDSTGSVARQWQIWAEERKIDPEKVLKVAHGVRAIEVIKQVAPHFDAEAEVRKIEQREADDHDGVAIMPGAVELVRSVPEGRWGVVTSGTRRLATARLQWANVPLPRVMVPADEVTNGKPHPEPYLKAAKLLGVNPVECVVIEDAPAGIHEAQAAGMRVIALTSTYPATELKEADAVITALADIRVTSGEGSGRLKISVKE